MDPHERKTGILVSQDDVDRTVKKAADAQLEAEVALKRAAKAARTANEIRKSTRELLKSLMNLERQILGGAQPRPMSSTRRARRQGLGL